MFKVIDENENTIIDFGSDIESMASYLSNKYNGRIARNKIGGKEVSPFLITKDGMNRYRKWV